jgi:hypothetical protein
MADHQFAAAKIGPRGRAAAGTTRLETRLKFRIGIQNQNSIQNQGRPREDCCLTFLPACCLFHG